MVVIRAKRRVIRFSFAIRSRVFSVDQNDNSKTRVRSTRGRQRDRTVRKRLTCQIGFENLTQNYFHRPSPERDWERNTNRIFPSTHIDTTAYRRLYGNKI